MLTHTVRRLTRRSLILATLILCLYAVTATPARADGDCQNQCMLNVLSICSDWEGDTWQYCVMQGQCMCASACGDPVPACGLVGAN
jgi:hypothetical protein